MCAPKNSDNFFIILNFVTWQICNCQVFYFVSMRQAIHHIEQQLSGYFKQHIEITNARQVFGGDINQTFELQTNLGSFFLKQHDDRLADMFEKEFAGLKLLDATNTVRVPKPVLHGNFENNIFIFLLNINKSLKK